MLVFGRVYVLDLGPTRPPGKSVLSGPRRWSRALGARRLGGIPVVRFSGPEGFGNTHKVTGLRLVRNEKSAWL